MPDLPQPKFRLRQTVVATTPDGCEHVTPVLGTEDGQNLGPKFGGPFVGTAYHACASFVATSAAVPSPPCALGANVAELVGHGSYLAIYRRTRRGNSRAFEQSLFSMSECRK